MAQDLLVGEHLTSEMIAAGAQLVVALDKLNVLVKGAFWFLIPEQHVWRLVVVSSEVAISGPRALYRKIRSALGKSNLVGPVVATKDIAVVDTADPMYAVLRVAISTGPGISGIRFSRNVINGQFIEDAYIYRVT